jgi:PucR C-terminal helix-turn-helix domain/GGDEF-like domain
MYQDDEHTTDAEADPRRRCPAFDGRRHRRGEIEGAALAALFDDRHALVGGDLGSSVRSLVEAAADCMLLNLEEGICVPDAVAAHASVFGHRAIRANLDLETVLRQCIEAITVLSAHILRDAFEEGARREPTSVVSSLFASFSSITSASVVAVAETYLHDATGRRASVDQRRLALVRLILTGNQVDSSMIEHPLGATHVGVVGCGKHAPRLIRELAATTSARSLIVPHSDGCVWAWLSRRKDIPSRDLATTLAAHSDVDAKLALGEPASGVTGFRLTHQQAERAFPVARLRNDVATRYVDVTLLAHAVQDATLSRSLINVHLLPLGSPTGSGATMRETLRAYFSAGRNVSAAAATLKVDRSTIRNRLDTIEQRLGRTLYSHQAELEVALALDQLTSRDSTSRDAVPERDC